MISEHDWDRLVRYVTGECDPAEARETLRWINADPERVRATNELSSLHQAGGVPSQRWDVDAAWQKVAVSPAGSNDRSATSARSSQIAAPRRPTPPVRHWARLASRLAAAIVLALSGGAFWYLVLSAHHWRAGGHPVALRETSTQRGQLMRIRLGDGTWVTLAAASRIRYSPDFGAPGRTRDVYLDGQALFNVTHDEGRPFRVHTRRAITEDIGTRFVVKSYPEDSTDRVVVTEGMVALRDARDSVLLTQGDAGIVARSGGPHAVRHTDISTDTMWTGGQLIFRDAPLRDVAVELGRWYDIDINLAEPELGNRLLTATFADVTREAVLADLARTLRLRVEHVGSGVRLLGR